MDEVRVNGNIILKNVPAMLDTGANFIYGDSNQVSELYKHIGGTLMEDEDFGLYHLPCGSFPTMSLTFGGRSFEIPLEVGPVDEGSTDCLSAIVAAQHSPDEPWIVGMPFLQGVYSVFDYDTAQVGFADLA